MVDFTGVTLRHGDEETPNEGGLVVACAPRRYHPPQTRRSLPTLDVHDEIDPTTREWVMIDETATPR